MARVIDAKYSTLLGTRREVLAFVSELSATKAAVIDLKFSNIVLIEPAVQKALIRQALEATPRRQA